MFVQPGGTNFVTSESEFPKKMAHWRWYYNMVDEDNENGLKKYLADK